MEYFLSYSEKPSGVSKAKEAPGDSKVVMALFGICQGTAGGCVALGVLVAVAEVARAALDRGCVALGVLVAVVEVARADSRPGLHGVGRPCCGHGGGKG